MKPWIDHTEFGSISVNKTVYNHDIFINLAGQVLKRKKKLSKAVYGTSHKISEAEARYILQSGVREVIIGAGQYSQVELSSAASEYFSAHNCHVLLLSTPEAVKAWNEAAGPNTIALFHITC